MAAILYIIKSSHISERQVPGQEPIAQIPALTYGRIIIRNSIENQHGGTYRNSTFLLEVTNSTLNTLARNCHASINLQNNTDITDLVGIWNRNNYEAISIGHPELMKLFTVSIFTRRMNVIKRICTFISNQVLKGF